MRIRLLAFLFLFPFSLKAQEVCSKVSPKPNFDRVINAKGEFISLSLKKDGFPAITFFDPLNKNLVFASAKRDGSWRMESIAEGGAGGISMESVLLSPDEVRVIFTNGNALYYFNNGTNLLDSKDGSYARGISAINLSGDFIVSYYFISEDKKNWKIGLRRNGNYVPVKEGWVHDKLQDDSLLKGISSALILSGNEIHLLYTNLETGSLDESILDMDLKVKSTSTIFKLLPTTKKFVAQWMRPFQEGEVFGITFYNPHIDVSCVGILKNDGSWGTPEYPRKRGGFGTFSYPLLINGSLFIFVFDGSYGSVLFLSRFEEFWRLKRLESKGFNGMWISAVYLPPDDFIFAFASADRDTIEVHYLSDY